MQEFLQYFTYPFVWRAMLGGALIAVNCGLLGPFLVLQRLSLLSEGYGHIALTGVALGILVGVDPIITIFIVVLLGGVAIRWMLNRNIFADAAISLLISFGVATSVLIIGAARGFTVNLYSYLIGSIFTLTPVDIAYISAAFVLTVGCVAIFYRDLFLMTFSSDLSYLMRGRRHTVAKNVFTLLIAINVVITIRAVGILLVSSMIVIPSLIAFKTSSSMARTLLHASGVALLSLVCGLLLGLWWDVPPSGAIVLVLLLVFVVVHTIKRPPRTQR